MALDWFNDDGIGLPMINDHVRNQYYDCILKDVVKGKTCIDIGFGTGLLSVLAIKHGANHVYAYEKDLERFRLGVELIEKSNLTNQITLYNTLYQRNNDRPDYIKFSEIVNENLWGEGLWHCLPDYPTTTFVPSVYFLEIVDIALPASITCECDHYFDPGVALPDEYVQNLNTIISQKVNKTLHQEFIGQLSTALPRLFPALLFRSDMPRKVIGGYSVDTQSCTLNISNASSSQPMAFEKTSINFNLPIDPLTPHLLIPRVGFNTSTKKLYLDTANSWGASTGIKLIRRNATIINVDHNTLTGDIKITRIE